VTVGIAWEPDAPGRHRQAGWLARWRQRRAQRVVMADGLYACTGDTAPSRRIEPGDRGMYVDPRQIPAMLMAPAIDVGQPAAPSRFASGGVVAQSQGGGDSVPAFLDAGFIVPRYMAEHLHRPRTGLGWPADG
jgi:hypothetical protein